MIKYACREQNKKIEGKIQSQITTQINISTWLYVRLTHIRSWYVYAKNAENESCEEQIGIVQNDPTCY